MTFSIPFQDDPAVLFVKKGQGFSYETRKDLIGKKGVTNRGYSWGQSMDRFIKDHLDMHRVERTQQGFRMLLRDDRDIDYYLYGLVPGQMMLYQMGIVNQVEYVKPPVTNEQFYFAFSKKSDRLALLPKINRVIKRLVDEKYLEHLNIKYIQQYRQQLGQ